KSQNRHESLRSQMENQEPNHVHQPSDPGAPAGAPWRSPRRGPASGAGGRPCSTNTEIASKLHYRGFRDFFSRKVRKVCDLPPLGGSSAAPGTVEGKEKIVKNAHQAGTIRRIELVPTDAASPSPNLPERLNPSTMNAPRATADIGLIGL